uniref:Uncharacterized protein n=1 Tax=Oryza meridionalis TaxID=40149 RepID=A0A0E0ERJ6_9ORYZ
MVRLDCDVWCSASSGGGGGSVGSGSNEGCGAVVSGVPLAAIQKGVGVAITSSFVLLFCPVSCSTSYECLSDSDWMTTTTRSGIGRMKASWLAMLVMDGVRRWIWGLNAVGSEVSVRDGTWWERSGSNMDVTRMRGIGVWIPYQDRLSVVLGTAGLVM